MSMTADNGDSRIVSETGVARNVAEIVEPVIEDMGYRLVRVRIAGQDRTTLQIMAERPGDRALAIEDCVAITRVLSPLLDVEDPVSAGYNLEVSSPGIDRPLVRPSDFAHWTGFEAKIELAELLAGRKRFRGLIEGFSDGEVRLVMELDGHDGPQVVGIPFAMIHEAKLVMTDELLKRTAQARGDAPAKSDAENMEA